MTDDDVSIRDLLGELPITDRDADRLDDLADQLEDYLSDTDARVCGRNYGEAELMIELGDLDDESKQARRDQIDQQYEWVVKARKALGTWKP